MSARRASRGRLDDSSSSTSSVIDGPVGLDATIETILSPERLAALEAVDVPAIPYNTYSIFSYIFSIRGKSSVCCKLAPSVVLTLYCLISPKEETLAC